MALLASEEGPSAAVEMREPTEDNSLLECQPRSRTEVRSRTSDLEQSRGLTS